MKTLIHILLLSITASTTLAAENINLDSLLKKLEQGNYKQSQQNKAREQAFINKRSQQDQLLQQSIEQRNAALQVSEQLETRYEENEAKLADLNSALTSRMGSLKELFGVLQQVAGDTQSKLESSLVSIQYPGRAEFLSNLAQQMGSSSKLASIEDIERVWFEMQREIIESGKVARFQTDVIPVEGPKQTREVVRVGTFNIVSDGSYLAYKPESDSVVTLPTQPSGRFTATAEDLQQAQGELVGFALDPTRGSILELLIQSATTEEQVHQGGIPGYIILALGLIALLIAIERFIALFIVEKKVKQQLKNNTINDNNPLGRILKVKEKYPHVAVDTLELKLSEAILKELPKITRSITFIKIISVVAPLLGLLGTVTGMINTFQMITLFGAGDPTIMAGGISQALVTTVLGLVVAIPTVLLYTWLNTRSKNIVHILQEQSAGIIAERAEQGA
ncbi:MotA/TolQ/ExbB proton channel family protein [Pleionea mediterranea]|uniref:Outer membrane transport energization protein ExbB n=1 Tax=Pleionea mediterranea TaxID=523701 RepID=A0A316FSH3_9GAMM|nr:MotA/TolQ/ExbB proton channel family protein [Pleionea mediterranea]PWK51718.1 outer membrane transport energization protein ExbB [Pleionea mediterranea]